MKTNQIQRLFEIDRRIRAGEHPTAHSLSVDLGVTPRQIYADRNRLIDELGAPLVRDPKTNGWIYTNTTWVLPTARLSEGEIVALFLTIELARSALNAGFEIPLESAIEKIARSLGNFVSVNLNTLKSATSHGLTPSAQTDIKTLVALYEAIGRRQKVHIHYFSASSGQYGERIIHPYHVLETRGEKILLAWDEKRDTIRNFNVARISKLTRLDAHFLMNEKFDAEQTIANMFFAESGEQTYTVVIAFDEYQYPYAVLIEVRPSALPVSYANAFVAPSKATQEKHLARDSFDKFKSHVEAMTKKFNLKSDARWILTLEDGKDFEVTGVQTVDDLDTLCNNVKNQVLALKGSTNG